MKKIFKKATCMVLALSSAVACLGMFTACETKNPEVKMKVEFEGETYTLEYKLYRELAPETVKHFLDLAANGYYNGVCVHNFEDGEKMYTGAYTYDVNAENGGIVYKNYYDIVAKYKDFNHTVWMDKDKKTPTYTLKGEFEANSFKVQNGSLLKQSFGSLTMEYTQKDFDEVEKVAVLRGDGKSVDNKDYQYNSATSQFSISLSDSEKSNSNYCTFATLKKGSKDDLNDLLAAIEAYESDFVAEYTVDVDRDDMMISEWENTALYAVPVSPIIIKSVKVTKY